MLALVAIICIAAAAGAAAVVNNWYDADIGRRMAPTRLRPTASGAVEPSEALALYRAGDYAKVGVPMLPIVAGRLRTRRHILAYTVLLLRSRSCRWRPAISACSMAPWR